MPLYEYKCEKHGIFTFRKSFEEGSLDDVVSCPECGKGAKRIFSVPAIEMRGLVGKSIKTEPDKNLEKQFGYA